MRNALLALTFSVAAVSPALATSPQAYYGYGYARAGYGYGYAYNYNRYYNGYYNGYYNRRAYVPAPRVYLGGRPYLGVAPVNYGVYRDRF